MNKKILVFSPESGWLYLWDFIIMVVININLFYIPLETVNQNSFKETYDWQWNGFNVSSIIIFIIGILINFNTGYYEDGQRIMDRSSII
jgi:hypothetical protein